MTSDAVDWANESFAIARKPELGCVMVGDTCPYEAANNPELDAGEREKVVVIDDVAGLLRRALGDQSP